MQPIDHPRPLDADVSVLRWPAEDDLRQQLAWFGLPRILLVEPGQPPPALLDAREDWMRTPADRVDLRARAEAVRQRAGSTTEPAIPRLDEDGLLRVGAGWVALTPTQVPVVAMLLAHLDRVVRFDELIAAYEGSGGSGHPASVRTLVGRLAARVRPLGLELVSVRRRGVLLTARRPAPDLVDVRA